MNTPKHTPGQWSAYNAKGGSIYKNWRVNSDAGRLVATIEEQPTGDEEVYNAALIAAAPTMLEVLKEATKLMGYYRPHDKYPDGSVIQGPSEIIRKLVAVCALAEGQDPGQAVADWKQP